MAHFVLLGLEVILVVLVGFYHYGDVFHYLDSVSHESAFFPGIVSDELNFAGAHIA